MRRLSFLVLPFSLLLFSCALAKGPHAQGSSTTIIVGSTPTSGGSTNDCLKIGSGNKVASGGCSAGGGSVTTVSVASANGFTGSVANPTTTPAITITTSINSPALAGNGTAIAAATTTGSGSTVVLGTAPTITSASLSGSLYSTSATVSAAGSNQAGATALTTDYNAITTVAASTGVALPIAVASLIVTVVNKGANALNVYPVNGGSAAIDALSANAAFVVPVNGFATFTARSSTQWDSNLSIVPSDSSGAGQAASYNATTKALGVISNLLQTSVSSTITVGYGFTPFAKGTVSSGTYTPLCSDGNTQTATNGGAHTLAAQASDCTIKVKYTNNGSAGTITLSGMSPAACGGDTPDTTNGHKFQYILDRVGGDTTCVIKAYQ